MTASRAEPFAIADRRVQPGTRERLEIPVARLPTQTVVNLPITVVHGLRPGPRLWLSAAVHGDELNGVEIIGRVVEGLRTGDLSGTLVAVPIVNVFGFIGQSRYLPDRRDLNRSFPGSGRGSLAGRLAHLFMTEVAGRCTHGIDLHTASQDRSNLPQVRADLRDPETRRCAEAFAAPVMVQSALRDGSLRAAASKLGIVTLLFEGGEPQRFNPAAIEVGERGVLRVMTALGMLPPRDPALGADPVEPSLHVERSRWIRARRGGLLRLVVDEGARVARRQVLGVISDPFGIERVELRAPFDGLVLGLTRNPVVHAGDALLHLGATGPADPG